MNQQLIAACQMFLIPASLLFIALGVARTEALKTLVSGIGLGVSVIWVCRIYRWAGFLSLGDHYTARGLAIIFLVATAICVAVHGWLWLKEVNEIGFLNTLKPADREWPRVPSRS